MLDRAKVWQERRYLGLCPSGNWLRWPAATVYSLLLADVAGRAGSIASSGVSMCRAREAFPRLLAATVIRPQRCEQTCCLLAEPRTRRIGQTFGERFSLDPAL